MAHQQLDEEAIFHIARKLDDPADRDKYLLQICAGDQALRERVEALLAVHEREQEFLRSSPDDPASTVDQSPLTERPGTTIGRYRLMEQVGEGGMGVVFVAEQNRPIRRKVALKIIKPGMDTKEVIARFEAERQALALMDHPNIAKVFDAGSTDSGRPYFVMELVRGIPITDYCDQAKLSIRERLELFIQVCQAIQHAHQKGIIHRDVKPSNVLVTLHDGKPVPKVIDFGVAKATNQRLTERTIYTRLAQFIGTPLYMSPEQAEPNELDVDTRSDVYSLGVLLYELLTGTTPFDKERFAKVACEEMRRIVKEEEPPRPSAKISTLGQTLTSVSKHRGTDPHGLSKFVRGDLDVIVMKSLEKDRTRRYDTASGLAADVQRFLGDEPIEARPPSAWYLASKFLRRNRMQIAVAAFVVLAIVFGLASATVAVAIAAILGLVGTSVGLVLALYKARQTAAALNDVRVARECAEQSASDETRARHTAERAVAQLVQLLREYESVQTEHALDAAFLGDKKRTRETAHNLSRIAAGLRPEQDCRYYLPTLEGVADLFGDDSAQALRHFRDALRLAPRVTTTQLWLAACAARNGEWAEHLHQLNQVSDLTDPEPDAPLVERVLRAYALNHVDGNRSANALRTIVTERRSWPIGHALLADSLAHAVAQTGNAQLVAEAIREIRIACEAMPVNAHLVVLAVWVYTNAIWVNRADVTWCEDAMRQADRFADELRERYPSYKLGRTMIAHYLETIGRDREAVEESKHGGYPEVCAAMLYRDNRCEEAELTLRTFDTGFQSRIAGLHAIMDRRDRHAEIVDERQRLLAEYPGTAFRTEALSVLLKLGRLDAARQEALTILTLSDGPHNVDDWLTPVARFIAGQLDETQFISTAGHSLWLLGNAHYWIGIRRLAVGDRLGARAALEACLAAAQPYLVRSLWAKALLKRMEGNSLWPEWIPQHPAPASVPTVA